MTIRNLKTWWAPAIGATLLLGACTKPYEPVQNGRCNIGRQWVAPSKDAQGNWKDGYCKDADK